MFVVRVFVIIAVLLSALTVTAQEMSSRVRKAIQDDSKTSLMEAAESYRYGHGVKTDIVEAARLYLRAANKGQKEAHYFIFDLWNDFNEQFTEPPFPAQQYLISQKEAIKYYESMLPKNKNNPELHYRLAHLYDQGVGIQNEDSKKSLKHYQAASKLGHKDARETLKIIKEFIKN